MTAYGDRGSAIIPIIRTTFSFRHFGPSAHVGVGQQVVAGADSPRKPSLPPRNGAFACLNRSKRRNGKVVRRVVRTRPCWSGL
jgi:hypothetical protein